MFRWISIVLLVIAGIGLGSWGYKEHEEKNAVLIQAENTYQRAFHELTYHMDLLHDKIGTALAASSEHRLSPELIEIWRITSESLGNVGQLPLSLLPFNKTASFLSDIGDFTYQTAARDLEDDPLSDEERADLEDLYEQAEDIQDELRQVQHAVLEENLRWMDVQLALATEDEPMDNKVIDGFETVEEKVKGYGEGNVESSIFAITPEKKMYQSITGEDVSEGQAVEKAREIFHLSDENLTISMTGEGAEIPMYSMSYRNDDIHAYMDMTKQGGHPVTIIMKRPIEEQTLSLYEGQKKAEDYLTSFDLNNMTLFQSSEHKGIGMYSYIYENENIRVLSDAVQIKVSLDNGDILGFSGRNFYSNHHNRDIPQPKITEEEAVDLVHEHLSVNEVHLAIMDDDFGEEVLVYEILGTLNEDTYRIFINAKNGDEEKVEKLSGIEVNFS